MPSTFTTSKSGPRAFSVAGESSSAIRTTGFGNEQILVFGGYVRFSLSAAPLKR